MTFTDPGVFVPLDPTRTDKRAANMGWITDKNGCDIWQGNRGGENGDGYGRAFVDGRMSLIHRVRYEREVGPIPEGMQLDHFVCDNGAGGCCKPFHCRPVAQRENLLRGNGVSAICAARTHCPKGHPLTGDNLERYQLKIGKRRCRICQNARRRVKRGTQ